MQPIRDSASAKSFFRALVCTATLLFLARDVTAQQTSPSAGTVAGVVRDTLGRALPNAEVTLPDISRSTRSDAEGKFALVDVARGEHLVWIRSLGYQAAQFRWESTAGGRIDIEVKMLPLPKTLDAVVVYAAEERNMKSRSVLAGVLTDSAGNPIEGAEVQLIGAKRTTYTNANGEFVLRNVPIGQFTLRAREMGYAPATKQVTLLQDDDRQVYMKMNSLAQTLDEQRVTAESGYGPHQDVWGELDKRLRFRQGAGSSTVLGSDQLGRAGKEPLDLLVREVSGGGYGQSSIRPDGLLQKKSPVVDGDACILENGWRPLRRPLRSYGAEQLEMVEYYPAVSLNSRIETEHSQSISLRMSSVSGCERDPNGFHPTYYVLWLKGSQP